MNLTNNMDNIEPALKNALDTLEKHRKEFFDKNKMDRIQGNNSSLNKIRNLKNDVVRYQDYECASYLRMVERAILDILDNHPMNKTPFVIENTPYVKPAVDKKVIPNYVLVCDVSDTGQLYYYKGYFATNGTHWFPVNTNEYYEAMKLAFEDEAELLCKKLNDSNKSFSYHVEEHMYSDDGM